MKNLVPLFLALLFLAGGAAASWVLLQAMGEAADGAGTRGAREALEASRAGEVRLAPVVEVAAEATAAAPAEVDPCILRNDEGILALERGDYEEAVSHFEFCIRTCPDEPAYRANLAEACGRLAVRLHQSEREVERARAIPLLRRAVELAPERTLPRTLLERWEREQEVPRCRECSGALKPATLAGGEPLAPDILRQAIQLTRHADCLLALGSSLQTPLAASLVEIAREHGSRVVVVTRSSTPFDSLADVKLDEPVARCLPTIVDGALGS